MTDPRWGGSLETMATRPQLPPVMGVDPTVRATGGWAVPAMDPHAEVNGRAVEEASGGRGSSLRTWVALTLAAGGIVVALLLLLPMLLKSPQVGQTEPVPDPASGRARASDRDGAVRDGRSAGSPGGRRAGCGGESR